MQFRGINYSSNPLGSGSSDPWNDEANQIPFDAQDIKDGGFNLYSIYVTATDTAAQLASMDDILEKDPTAAFVLKDFVTYDTDYSIATGGTNRTAKIDDFVDIVAAFKGRADVKGFFFANENNLAGNRSDGTSEADWYSLVDAAIAAGKAEDDSGIDRFYGTIDSDLGTYPGDAALTNLDVLGLNVYRGTTFTDLKRDIILATNKPVIITEFGIERADNTQGEQDDQATELVALIEEAESYYPYISSTVLFKWTHNSNDTQFYHIAVPLADGVNQSRTKYSAYNEIKTYYASNSYSET